MPEDEYKPTKKEIEAYIAEHTVIKDTTEGHQIEVNEYNMVNVWLDGRISASVELIEYLMPFESSPKKYDDFEGLSGKVFFNIPAEQALCVIGMCSSHGEILHVEYEFEEPCIYLVLVDEEFWLKYHN
jgi:hypothetical protein